MDNVIVASVDDDGLKRLEDAMEYQYLDRNIRKGDLDGRDASFLVVLSDAVAMLKGSLAYKGDLFVVSLVPGLDAGSIGV